MVNTTKAPSIFCFKSKRRRGIHYPATHHRSSAQGTQKSLATLLMRIKNWRKEQTIYFVSSIDIPNALSIRAITTQCNNVNTHSVTTVKVTDERQA